jgi:hypothetical protein
MPLREEDKELVQEYIDNYGPWYQEVSFGSGQKTYWLKDYDLSKNPKDLIEQYSPESAEIISFNKNQKEEKRISEKQVQNRKNMLSGSDDYWQHYDLGLVDDLPHLMMKDSANQPVSEEPFATENLASGLEVGILGSEPVDSAANDYNIVSTNTMSSSDRMLEQRGVQDQKTIVIPIVMPQKRRQSVTPVPEPLGLSSKSTSEAANPTMSTRDSFISGTLDARS